MDKELKENTEFSHYRIVSKIGSGGMGEVYLAQDTKLDRKVAIKFLHHELSKDADKLNRFIQEAKAVSALNHPNILTVHEIGENDDSNFIVTEYIEGKTLREHLSHKERLQLNSILKIGVQVSEALSAAHQAGIIHRDIKPENIMIRKDGYPKVLDFGLAKLSERRGEGETGGRGEGETRGYGDGESNTLIAASPLLPVAASVNTTPGMVMGTVSYMSPEQARGNPTDARTDIWSLGVVLYEMLAGKVPFSGETVNHTIVSILEKEPHQLENVPGELRRIVRKSLTKDVDMRYQSARDLLIDLKNLRRELDIQGELERSSIPNREPANSTTENATQMLSGGGESTVSGQNVATQNVATSSSSLEYAVTQAKSHKVTTAIFGVLLVGVIAAAGYFGFLSKGSSSGQINSIAVMPFVNDSGNPEVEYLSEGMTETLIKSLSSLPELDVKPRSSVFRYKGKETDLQTIGKELNVQAILNGRVAGRGDQLMLSLELVDVQKNRVIWSEQYDRKQSDLVNLQSEIAKDVSAKLKSKLSGADEAKVTKAATVDPEAYQAYLKGRYYWNRRTEENIKKAIEQFRVAADLDPNYALAYSGLADCYVLLAQRWTDPTTDLVQQAKMHAERAATIDPTLAEPHASLGMINRMLWRWTESENEFRRAIELNPTYPTSYHWYSVLLRDLGRYDEAAVMVKRAQELDPLSSVINVNASISYLIAKDYEASIENSLKVTELNPNFGTAYELLGLAQLKLGRNADAVASLEKAAKLTDRYSFVLGDLGYVYAKVGKRDQAVAIIQELKDRNARKESAGRYIAAVHMGLGENDQAFEWLEKDFRNRAGTLATIRYSEAFESIRNDPRYKDLLKRMGLPE